MQLLESDKTLTKAELKYRIGDHQFITTQRQYMERVNQVLFGFENVADYKETVDLLLRLRAPKLSNNFKPSLLNEVLGESLQPLSDEDLRDMSDSIANMDDLKDQMESLQESISSAEDIMRTYQLYNHAVVYDKLQVFEDVENKVKLEEVNLAKDKSERENLVVRQAKVATLIVSLQDEQALLKEEAGTLANSDVLRLQQEIAQLTADLTKEQSRLAVKKKTLIEKDNQFIDKKNDSKKYRDEIDRMQIKINRSMDVLDLVFDEWSFREHTGLKSAVCESLSVLYNYAHVFNQLDRDLTDVLNVRDLFHQLNFLEQKLKEILNVHEQNIDFLDQSKMQQKKAEHEYRGLVDDYKEKIAKWSDQNKLVNLDEAGLKLVINKLLAYETSRNYQSIISFITAIRNDLRDELSDQLVREEMVLKTVKKEKFDVEMDLESWKNYPAVKPELSEVSIANRAYLEELKIPYIPVYEVLEFADELSADEINKIEETMLRTGLLNALFVEEKYRPFIIKGQPDRSDNYLFIKRPIEKVETLILRHEVGLVDLFKDLGANINSDFSLNSDAFRIGILEGNLSGSIAAKYLGAKARENHRQQMIEGLWQQLNEYKEQVTTSETKIGILKADLLKIDEEMMAFPAESELADTLQIMMDIQDQIKEAEEKKDKLLAEIGGIRASMSPIYESIKTTAHKFSITTNKKAFDDLEEHIRTYKQELHQLAAAHNDYSSSYSLWEIVQTRIDELITELDECRFEISDVESTISRQNEILEMKQSTFKEYGIEDISSRLEEITSRLRAIPNEIGNLERERGRNEAQLDNLQTTIINRTEHLVSLEQCKEYNWDVLKAEVEMGLIPTCESWTAKTLGNLRSENPINATKEKLYRDLFDKFHARKGYLQVYGLTMSHIEGLTSPYESIKTTAGRDILTARLDGRQISLSRLLERLASDKEILAQILRDEDRKIFEEILISTISKRIRDRVKNSRDWVSKMNGYIDAMNTSRSSGLKLRLTWKPHSASLEGELGTKELVDLLMRDEHLLTDAHKRKVSTHFRTKIEFARDADRNEGVTASFHQIMREVMDYRKWFTFTIYYKKTNESQKELTNTAFATLSGGEKAMSMYVPLFSAVAAKFSSAKPDSPTIIALDEAFAGVDEKNIDAMFGLIENFGFDYILNSQALWGDYPEVQDLAIYELFRPDNATFVTTMRYHWNGNARTYIGE